MEGLMRSLAAVGFRSVAGGLKANEGTLLVSCGDGVAYALRFGKVIFAQGEALSAGTSEDSSKAEAPPKPGDPAKDAGAVESRYLFVTVEFDPKMILEPAKPAAAPEPGSLPGDVFRRSAAEVRAAADAASAATDAYKKRVEAGRGRVEKLSKRFAPWYYVVPGDDYRAMLMDRNALVRLKPPPGQPEAGAAMPFGRGGSQPPFRLPSPTMRPHP